jgi:hypothetical protein
VASPVGTGIARSRTEYTQRAFERTTANCAAKAQVCAGDYNKLLLSLHRHPLLKGSAVGSSIPGGTSFPCNNNNNINIIETAAIYLIRVNLNLYPRGKETV